MIETARSITIGTDIGATWDYVQDIRRWSNLFPGCEHCDVIDDHDSRWVIKVGAGGLVRTVHVQVHVERWAGPWPAEERWWDPEAARRRARFQMVAGGRAFLLALEGSRWWVEATYD